MINVVLLLGLVTFTSLACEWVTLASYQDRLHCQASFLTGTLVWKFLVNDWIPRKPEFAANHEKKWFSLWAGDIFAVLWFLLHVHLMVCWSEPGRVRLSWNEVYKVNNLQKFVVDDPHFIDDSSVEAHNSSKSLQNSSTALLVKSYDRVMDCLETPFDCFSDLF